MQSSEQALDEEPGQLGFIPASVMDLLAYIEGSRSLSIYIIVQCKEGKDLFSIGAFRPEQKHSVLYNKLYGEEHIPVGP